MGPQENYEYKGRKYTQTDLAGIAGIMLRLERRRSCRNTYRRSKKTLLSAF